MQCRKWGHAGLKQWRGTCVNKFDFGCADANCHACAKPFRVVDLQTDCFGCGGLTMPYVWEMETDFTINIPSGGSYTRSITEPETGDPATGTLTQYLPINATPVNLINITLDGTFCEWSNSVWTYNHYFYRPSVGFRGSPTCPLIPGEFSLHSTTAGAGRFISNSGSIYPLGCSVQLGDQIPRPSVPPFVTLACSNPGSGGRTPQGIASFCYGWTWYLRRVSGVITLTLSVGGTYTYQTSIPYKAAGSGSPPWVSFYGYFVGSAGSSLTWGVGGGPGPVGFPGSQGNLFEEHNWTGVFNCSQTTRPLRMTLNRVTTNDAFSGRTLLNLADLPSSITLVGG